MPPAPIKIADTWIGDGFPVFVVAEIGVNHNGDLELAKRLVDASWNAGADAVKFQTFKTELLVTAKAPTAQYQKANTGIEESQASMLKKLEISDEAHCRLKEYCESRGIIFLSTPFDLESLELLHKLEVPAFKIGSSDADNIPFLKKVAALNKPMIVSSGMSTLSDLEDSVAAIRTLNGRLILLQCTTAYPCPPEQTHLASMNTLRSRFDVLAGFSDHTLGFTAAAVAAALGASVIEKHLTLSRNLPGPDHCASTEPKEFGDMVSAIRSLEALPSERRVQFLQNFSGWERYLGSAAKDLAAVVLDTNVRTSAKKSIVASVDIPASTILQESMMIIKRPGTGIRPRELASLIGRRTKKAIRRDEVLLWDMIED